MAKSHNLAGNPPLPNTVSTTLPGSDSTASNPDTELILTLAKGSLASKSPVTYIAAISGMSERIPAVLPAGTTIPRSTLFLIRKMTTLVSTSVTEGGMPEEARETTISFLNKCVVTLALSLLAAPDQSPIPEMVGAMACLNSRLGAREQSLKLLDETLVSPILSSPEAVRSSLIPPFFGALAAFWIVSASDDREIVIETVVKIVAHTAAHGQYECVEAGLSALFFVLFPAAIGRARSVSSNLILYVREEHNKGDAFAFRVLTRLVAVYEKLGAAGWMYASKDLSPMWSTSIKCGSDILNESFPSLPLSFRALLNKEVFVRCTLCNEATIERAKRYHGLTANQAADLKVWLFKVAAFSLWFDAIPDLDVQKEALGSAYEEVNPLLGKQSVEKHDHSIILDIASSSITFPAPNSSSAAPSTSAAGIPITSPPNTTRVRLNSQSPTSRAQSKQRVARPMSNVATLAPVHEEDPHLEEAGSSSVAGNVPLPSDAIKSPPTRTRLPVPTAFKSPPVVNHTVVNVLGTSSKPNSQAAPTQAKASDPPPPTKQTVKSKPRSTQPPAATTKAKKVVKTPTVPTETTTTTKATLKRKAPASTVEKENAGPEKRPRSDVARQVFSPTRPSSQPSTSPAKTAHSVFLDQLVQAPTRQRGTISHPQTVAGPSRLPPQAAAPLLPGINLLDFSVAATGPSNARDAYQHTTDYIFSSPIAPGPEDEVAGPLRRDGRRILNVDGPHPPLSMPMEGIAGPSNYQQASQETSSADTHTEGSDQASSGSTALTQAGTRLPSSALSKPKPTLPVPAQRRSSRNISNVGIIRRFKRLHSSLVARRHGHSSAASA
ncbi:hypothetical protein SISNIDRAFT_482655 [Sistotremastrum niveocremeum HHB9708]|uniref:Uncharacterized protein n=1 Tax=Sistotremastrum niveocremeum HHB9708 TaxID=1314777 RepID=A0A164YFZ2_9AGAM|nr:hypothetical protein SISNIDRAFT_482655 [Sistotremastrum niveocremeum HHB9708]